MANITNQFVTSFSELYFSTTKPAATTDAGLRTWIDTTTTTATKKVPLVMEIGTIASSSTVIETPTFGEAYKNKLLGQIDGGTLDSVLYWAPRDPEHLALRTAHTAATKVYVAVEWVTDSAGTDKEFVYFEAFISDFSVDTTFDDVAKANCTFVVDGAQSFVGAS